MVEPSTPVATVVLHVDEEGVAARHEQHDERQLERRLLEQRRVEVGLEVVDGDERHVPGQRQGLGRGHADEQRADQAGPVGGGHGVDVAVLVLRGAVGQARLDEGLRDDGHEEVDVGAAGDLGHDAAVAGVEVDLAADHRRQRPRCPPARWPRPSRRRRSRCRGCGPGRPPPRRGRHRSSSSWTVVPVMVVGQAIEPLVVLGGVHVVGPHHERILVRLLVVALADPGRHEPEPPVQLLRGPVAEANLEREVLGAPRHCGVRQREQQAQPDLVAVPGRVDGEGGDVAVLLDEHHARRSRPPWSRRGRPRRPGRSGSPARS